MLTIRSMIEIIERFAHPGLQEHYDNSGLIVGNPDTVAKGVVIAMDATPEVLQEAIDLECNLLVTHHPAIFKPIKRLRDNDPQERLLMEAIRHDISLYACHTNLDSIPEGVSGRMADQLELVNRKVLVPKREILFKLVCFVPHDHLKPVSEAIFNAGAGHIGRYDSCSFYTTGTGTFRGEDGTEPYIGAPGVFHEEKEFRLETIVPKVHLSRVIHTLLDVHPYQEVAYDIYPLENEWEGAGIGIIGELTVPMEEITLLNLIKNRFGIPAIRHTKLTGRIIRRIAVCGGSGAPFISSAKKSGADLYLTGDLKYHDFFEADGNIILVDAGHYETEQFALGILHDLLTKNFPKFAVHLSKVNTNPINYY